MKTLDYVITTDQCVVPHVVDLDKFPKKPIVIYVDDILYKDSYYDKGGTRTLKEFLAVENDILLAFREKSKTLISKRGNYKLSRERYEELINIVKPDYYADYQTSKSCYKGLDVVEPKDIDDLVAQIKNGAKMLGTGFIRELSEMGKMLRVTGNEIRAESIFDCGCCGNLSPGYLEYIYRIKEMNAIRYIMVRNIKTFGNIIRKMRSGEITVGEIRVVRLEG